MTNDSALLQMVGGGSGGKTVKGMHGVFVTSPDPTRHVAVGGGGEMGFVLPLADLMTGAQPGFDQSRAGKVIINPNENGEGIAVDLSRITAEDMSRAMRMSADPSEAMEKLAATKIKPKTVERPMTSENIPTATQTPGMVSAPMFLTGMTAVPTAGQLHPANQFVTAPGSPIPQPPLSWPGTIPVPQQQVAPLSPAAQVDPLSYIMQTMQGMQNQLNQLRQPPAPIYPEPKLPEAPPVKAAAADLDVPWITAEVTPPMVDVMFDLGPGGFSRSKYHHAEVTSSAVILIFDTRFPYSTEYTPPYTRSKNQPPITLQVGRDKTKIQAHHYQGMAFALGVFNFTILLICPPVAEPAANDPADML